MTKVANYVEIDVPHCSLTYGVSPCQASLVNSPPTGTIKCFNSLGTCQDRANFTDVPVTVRFSEDVRFDQPTNVDAYALIRSIDYQPAIVSLGGDIGQRAALKVTFKDARHSDPGPDWDKYPTERTYTDPYARGTFWGKFRSRNPFLRGRAMRLYTGIVGQTLATYEVRHFFVESIEGPDVDGTFVVTGKDVLKLSAADRAQAPQPTNAYLTSDIAAGTGVTAALSPSGAGALFGTSGEAVIGGNEVVTYGRDATAGNDSNTKLLLHMDATFVDSSSAAHGTPTNSNDPSIDTGFFKFGPGSGFFDGNDFVFYNDHADWTLGGGTGNFTVDCWIYSTSLSAGRVFLSHFSDFNNYWRFWVQTTGAIVFQVFSGAATIIEVASSAGAITTVTWYHVALVRNGNNYNIYVNGTSVASATDTDAIPNFTNALNIGADTSGTNFWFGYMDELRISDVARWTANFTSPNAPYSTSTDQLYLTARGTRGTTAATHSAQDTVQLPVIYTTDDPADIIYDLLTTYANISPSYITLSDWQLETATYLGGLVMSLFFAQPTGVDELVSEIIDQIGASIWWDDINQKVRFQILKEVASSVRYTEDDVMENTMAVREQPEKRVSQVYVYFGQINPTLKKDEIRNYRSVEVTTDAQSEADEGSAAIKKIYARGIAAGGRSIATTIAQKHLSRFIRPPRRFNWEMLRHTGQTPALGLGLMIGGGAPRKESWPFQDETGAREEIPVQITRLGALADKHVIEAEEMVFSAAYTNLNPSTRTIIIDVNENFFNLRTRHDQLYAPAVSGNTVNCYIQQGVIVGCGGGTGEGGTPTEAAFDTGTFAAGVNIHVYVLGRIQGHGGQGGGSIFGIGFSGSPGTLALKVRQTTTVHLDAGDAQIWGGGGGGGGGSTGGGGGGAGTDPGFGANSTTGWHGQNGTQTAGGNGGNGGGPGGNGGGPGLVGANGGSTGGAAGNAIDGIGFVTKVGTGDIRGAQV